jgi:hypothetical protein
VNYYTRHQIRILNGRCNNIWYGSKFPDAPPIFDDDASFERLWNSDTLVFLLTDAKATPSAKTSDECPQKDRLPEFRGKRGGCVLAKWGGKLLGGNRPACDRM